MLSGELAAFLAKTLQIKTGTVLDAAKHLRVADLLSVKGRGPRSGAQMTTADAVNWLLALIIEHEYGSDVAGNVDRIRRLPLETIVGQRGSTPIETLAVMKSKSLGAALEALVDGIRCGEYAAVDEQIGFRSVNLTLDSPNRLARLHLSGEDFLPDHAELFFARKTHDYEREVWWDVNLSKSFFEKLAAALGPLER